MTVCVAKNGRHREFLGIQMRWHAIRYFEVREASIWLLRLYPAELGLGLEYLR